MRWNNLNFVFSRQEIKVQMDNLEVLVSFYNKNSYNILFLGQPGQVSLTSSLTQFSVLFGDSVKTAFK